MTPIEATLVYSRGTKELGRYIEGVITVNGETKEKSEVIDKDALIGVLYVSKERLGAKPPKVITVTITGGDDATD